MNMRVIDDFSFFGLVNRFQSQDYEVLIQYNTRASENYQSSREESSVLSLKDFLHKSSEKLIESLHNPLYINILNDTKTKIVVLEYDIWLGYDEVEDFLSNVAGVN